MKRERIEPTLGPVRIDTNTLPTAARHDTVQASSTSSAWREGLALLVVLLLLFVIALALASQNGMAIPVTNEHEGAARLLVLGGLFIVLGSQWVGAILLLRRSAIDALLSLIVPLYVLIALKKTRLLAPVTGVLTFGAAMLALGTALLS